MKRNTILDRLDRLARSGGSNNVVLVDCIRKQLDAVDWLHGLEESLGAETAAAVGTAEAVRSVEDGLAILIHTVNKQGDESLRLDEEREDLLRDIVDDPGDDS